MIQKVDLVSKKLNVAVVREIEVLPIINSKKQKIFDVFLYALINPKCLDLEKFIEDVSQDDDAPMTIHFLRTTSLIHNNSITSRLANHLQKAI